MGENMEYGKARRSGRSRKGVGNKRYKGAQKCRTKRRRDEETKRQGKHIPSAYSDRVSDFGLWGSFPSFVGAAGQENSAEEKDTGGRDDTC